MKIDVKQQEIKELVWVAVCYTSAFVTADVTFHKSTFSNLKYHVNRFAFFN